MVNSNNSQTKNSSQIPIKLPMLQPQQGQATSIVSNSVVINNSNYTNLLGAQISTENQSCIQIQTAPDNFPVNHPEMMMLSVNSQNPSPNMIFSNKKDG
jgi:hypothetical protein